MQEEYIIYNPTLGINDIVNIGEIEQSKKQAWLEEPYEMVGPFSLDELRTNGQIAFAACFVMSKQRWQDERVSLQKEAFKRQQKVQREHIRDDKEHREVLSLPLDGELNISQIKTAYRKIIKTAHPDVGGSHEMFISITAARDTLLKIYS